jgi:hypothetical protein
MAVARSDCGDEEHASTGAGANELSTRAGEKDVHERVNGCGSGGFACLPAGAAAGDTGERQVCTRQTRQHTCSVEGHHRQRGSGKRRGKEQSARTVRRHLPAS